MGGIINRPRIVVRRGMKRTVEDLGDQVTDIDVLNICETHTDDWTDAQEAQVQACLDGFKAD